MLEALKLLTPLTFTGAAAVSAVFTILMRAPMR